MIWFLMRGTGVVLLALMTLSTMLGVLSTVRTSSPRWPRFATQAVHRNASLLTVVLLIIHGITAVIHNYVDIRWYDLFIPVGGKYVTQKEFPGMALASLAFDLTLAVVITSLLRTRMPHRTWRLIHLTAYVAWAAGLVHGYLVGTDTKSWWALGVTLICLGGVTIAIVARIGTARHEARRDALSMQSR